MYDNIFYTHSCIPLSYFYLTSKLLHLHSFHSEGGPTTHLNDGGFADVLCSGGAVEHPVAVWSPLDVAQPAGPVGVAHQVGVESDRVIAGVTCRRSSLMIM